MPRDATRDLRKTGRRNFVKTLAGIGISGSSLRYLTKDRLLKLTDHPDDEVPVLARLEISDDRDPTVRGRPDERPPEREPVYRTVPRDEWVRVEAAHRANQRIAAMLDRLPGAARVYSVVTTRSDTTGDRKAVEVRYPTLTTRRHDGVGATIEPNVALDAVRRHIPDAVDGTVGSGRHEETVEDIPVYLEREELEEQAYYDEEYDPIPGGCQFKRSMYEYGGCTLGTLAFDHDTFRYVMATAGHCIDDSMNDTMYQPGGWGTGFGQPHEVLYDYQTNDAGTIDLRHTNRAKRYGIAAQGGGTDFDVEGVIPASELKHREGDAGWLVNQQGRTSGRDTGWIEGVSTARTLGYIELSGVTTSDGDSGGPYFRVEGDGAYIAGIHAWSAPSGNVMEKIEDYFNIEVNY